MKKIKRVFCALALLGTSIIGICSSNKNNSYNGENEKSINSFSSYSNKTENYGISKENLLQTYGNSISYSNDLEGDAFGFEIDTKLYDVIWKDHEYVDAKYNNHLIGRTYIKYGKAVGKTLVEGKHFITYLINVRTVGSSFQSATYKYTKVNGRYKKQTTYHTEYGYNRKCNLYTTIENGNELLASSPLYRASSTSYSVGLGAGVDSKGVYNFSISGSVNFVSNALNITNKSSGITNRVDVSIDLNESCWSWDWGRYIEAMEDHSQLFTFSVLADDPDAKQCMTIYTQYRTINNGTVNCGFNVSINNHYSNLYYSTSI